ncbi:hypothetical protein Sjap_001988 [Stephania japonica]|uniref:Uncharacterized protein n=1 Tax=Stephania japonica TaxID=461633 RepID=A0AAP0PS28_9MAGN
MIHFDIRDLGYHSRVSSMHPEGKKGLDWGLVMRIGVQFEILVQTGARICQQMNCDCPPSWSNLYI